MRAPKLYETTRSREMTQEFRGYNHTLRIGENEFYDMENLTSDYYPVLSPRNKRGSVKKIGLCNGMLAKNELAYVDGNVLHYGQHTMQLSASVNGERQLISMGAYMIVFPDMRYANTANWEDQGYFGSLHYHYDTDVFSNIRYSLCDKEGNDIKVTYIRTPIEYAGKHGANTIEAGSALKEEGYDEILFVGSDLTIPVPSSESVSSGSFDIGKFDFEIDNTDVLDVYRGDDVLNWKIDDVGGRLDNVSAKIAGEATVSFYYDGQLYDSIRIKVVDKDFERSGDGEYCLDLRPLPQLPPKLSRYDKTADQWVQVPSYVKITIDARDNDAPPFTFQADTTIHIQDRYAAYGLTGEEKSHFFGNSESQKYRIIQAADTFLVLDASLNYGLFDETSKYDGYSDDYFPMFSRNSKYQRVEDVVGELSLKHYVPNMDFLIESENRLWGCRYGENVSGSFVNEIYASAQGDFFNWETDEGVSTDSYVASLGSDGPFTGAINYRNHPIFFKENCYHTVYGSYPENYQIVTETGTGVQSGSAKSLCVISGVLYYKAPDGVYRYDGASYEKISEPLGFETYSEAVGGALNGKYYLAMTAEDSTRALFVYDTTKNLWHKENASDMSFFVPYKGDLWFCDGEWLRTVKGTQGTPEERDVEWFAETGVIGFSSPDHQYVGKLQVRLMLPVGSYVNFYVEYDSDEYWDFVGGIEGTSLMSFTLPIIPRRCDHFKLRISGVGECKIFSIAKVMEDGGDA